MRFDLGHGLRRVATLNTKHHAIAKFRLELLRQRSKVGRCKREVRERIGRERIVPMARAACMLSRR